MFEVGFTEIVLIMGLALLVLGPEKLPGLARTVGRWTGRARSMARQLRMQLEQEVTLEELAKTSRSTQARQPEQNEVHASSEAAPAENVSTHDESASLDAEPPSPEPVMQPDEAPEKTTSQ
jgi:sec-independent protein translocase protein TatB